MGLLGETNLYTTKELIRGKIYILGVAGAGPFSKAIQFASKDSSQQPFKRWSHVAVCFWHWSLNQWVVVESIYPFGVRLTSLTFWLNDNWQKPIVEAFEYSLIKPSELFKHLGKAYSVRDIARLARQRFTPFDFITPNDKNRYYCAELLADCDNGNMINIQGLPSHQIIPTDYQDYGVTQNAIFDFRSLFVDVTQPLGQVA